MLLNRSGGMAVFCMICGGRNYSFSMVIKMVL